MHRHQQPPSRSGLPVTVEDRADSGRWGTADGTVLVLVALAELCSAFLPGRVTARSKIRRHGDAQLPIMW
jgi:hypothetical protein